jgi:colanic acid/amylovoran biosynthesis glycosyltransferase
MSASSLRVLAYHRVTEAGRSTTGNRSLISATPAVFERQIQHLVNRYRVVSLAEVLDAQRGGTPLPRRAVLLTFDDGYTDFGEVVWPMLEAHGLPATVFVPTAYPDSADRRFWWERLQQAITHSRRGSVRVPALGTLRLDDEDSRRAALLAVQSHVKRTPQADAMALLERLFGDLGIEELPAPHVLGWDELRRLAREGVAIAAHTRTHPALTQVTLEAVRAEVRGSLDDIKRQVGAVPPVFCCPFGLFDDRVVEELERHHVELAFTCLDGHNSIPSSDPLRLRRTEITRRTSPSIFPLRLIKAVSYVDMWRHRAKPGDLGSARWPNGREPAENRRKEPGERPRDEPGVKVAYIMSRFPKLSETFVLNEILTLESFGVSVEVYPLLRERQPVSHPEALRLAGRAHFHPFLSAGILRAQAHFIRRRPADYFRALFEVLRGTLGSANFFLGAIGIFPKSVRFAYEMRKLGVAHVHAHFCSHPAVAALIIHRLTGIPFSFTAHGSDLHVERRMLDRKVEASAFAVTVCDFNREVMVRTCGERLRHKIHVLHCGVDARDFSASEARCGDDPFQIISVASLEEVKGHRFLIEACRLLRARGVEFRCHLVGAGPLRASLEAAIAGAGLGEHVHLHGGQPRAAVARLLARVDAAVLASHPTREGKREGLSVALMEAMAAELPVVASDISGIPELVEHERSGLLVPSGDPVVLADALERLSRDHELRRRMGEAGRRKVLRAFSLEANARHLLGLFRGVEAAGAIAPADGGAAYAER